MGLHGIPMFGQHCQTVAGGPATMSPRNVFRDIVEAAPVIGKSGGLTPTIDVSPSSDLI